jgi:hypothetical protein
MSVLILRTAARRVAAIGVVSSAASTIAAAALQPSAHAYEWQDGPGKTCGGQGTEVVVISAFP